MPWTRPTGRRLRAVAPRRAEDRRREDLTDVFRLAWEHGVNGQAQVIKGMQQSIHSYTVLQDREAMSEAVRQRALADRCRHPRLPGDAG